MKIKSIEPTPSPYSMKINVTETLPDGQTENYKLGDDLTNAPTYAKQLFEIEGVKDLYRVIDFIALERNPKVPWEEILPQVKEVFGEEESNEVHDAGQSDQPEEEAFGEVKVFFQVFRNIPVQVKLEDDEGETRFGLDQRFMHAAMEASENADYLAERKWVEQDPRYGNPGEIGQDIVDEIEASYDEERLNRLVEMAKANETAGRSVFSEPITIEDLEVDDWKERYRKLERMPDPTVEDLPVLGKALDDAKMSIRRLATAYLGMIEEKEVLPYLEKALKDKTVTVRRTAGDCMSDIGFTEAIPAMIETLEDKSRIVRWRGAMFLYEYGDESAIPALEKALEDPEFEVRMQAKMALGRIQGGEAAQGSIWKQMSEMIEKKNKN